VGLISGFQSPVGVLGFFTTTCGMTMKCIIQLPVKWVHRFYFHIINWLDHETYCSSSPYTKVWNALSEQGAQIWGQLYHFMYLYFAGGAEDGTEQGFKPVTPQFTRH
jgi:hypothetical protein